MGNHGTRSYHAVVTNGHVGKDDAPNANKNALADVYASVTRTNPAGSITVAGMAERMTRINDRHTSGNANIVVDEDVSTGNYVYILLDVHVVTD
jgi:hypothetical protein